MPLPKERRYTSEDYWNLPDGQRAELIDGQLYNMSAPSQIHQELVAQLTRIIGNYIADHKGKCKVLPAPFAVNLNKDDSVYVEPDVSVICDSNKLDGKRCNGAPDFVIEIVSPSSRSMDYITKTGLYRNSGVKEYWIVDPTKERTLVYRFNSDDTSPAIYPWAEPIPVGICETLHIIISDLL